MLALNILLNHNSQTCLLFAYRKNNFVTMCNIRVIYVAENLRRRINFVYKIINITFTFEVKIKLGRKY